MDPSQAGSNLEADRPVLVPTLWLRQGNDDKPSGFPAEFVAARFLWQLHPLALIISDCVAELAGIPGTYNSRPPAHLTGFVILGAEEHFMARAGKTLLCIDDHKSAVAGWCLYLQSAGYRVETAFDATEGLQLFATQPIDLVLLDYAMPDANGAEVAATMKQIKPAVRILMFSGVSHLPEDARAHADAFLEKGQHPTVVLGKIDELLCEPTEGAA